MTLDATMTYADAIAKREEITARVLKIEADLLASKAEFFSGGPNFLTTQQRIVMDAERAQLVAERHRIQVIIHSTASVMRESKYAALVRLLHERDLGHLVVEAKRINESTQEQQE